MTRSRRPVADTRTLTDRAQAALIREWADDNGFTVSKGGRIPAGVRQAYEAAHAGEDDPGEGDGPDWTAAAAEAGADPLAQLEAELEAGEQDQAAGGADAHPPPPADLAEARARFGGKPKRPPWAGEKKTGKGEKKAPPVKVTRAVIGDMEGKLALLLTPPVLAWQMADPLCGGAAADNLDNIVRKSVPLMAQSPDVVNWFTKGTTFMLWMDLVLAVQPVALTLWKHHVAEEGIMLMPDGSVVPSVRLEDGRKVPADGTVPTRQAPVDNSMYSADVTGHIPDVQPA